MAKRVECPNCGERAEPLVGRYCSTACADEARDRSAAAMQAGRERRAAAAARQDASQEAAPSVVSCADCGGTVSRRALVCPHCGAPGPGARNSGRGDEPDQDDERLRRLIRYGWLGALLFPIVGLILGILVIVRGRVATGVAQILVSVAFGGVLWVVLKWLAIGVLLGLR